MLSLARSVAILDEHTCLTCLETDSPRKAALGTADDDLIQGPFCHKIFGGTNWKYECLAGTQFVPEKGLCDRMK